MTVLPDDFTSEAGRKAVRAQVERIVKSGAFQQAQRRRRFLEYVVDELLAGRGGRLKGYANAREVFDRFDGFDSNVDPIVRVEAGRVRDKLREYYETDGRNDPIRIDLRKGSDAPTIEFRQEAAASCPDANQFCADVDRRRIPGADRRACRRRGTDVVAAASGNTDSEIIDRCHAIQEHRNRAQVGSPSRRHNRRHNHRSRTLERPICNPRNTTEIYKGRPVDIRTVGRELGVHCVLEGSIQPNVVRVRFTAQLINAETGGHVWSARYDRPAADLFNVQNEVTEKIATTLIVAEGAVAEAERSLFRRKPPASLTAFDTYLLAMDAQHKVTKDSLSEAEGLFSKVIELDPDDGNSHLAPGGTYGYAGKVQQAAVELNKAEALSPSDADLLLVIAWSLCTFGETERALTLTERSLQFNPQYADWYNQGLAVVYFLGEEYEKAAKYASLINEPLAPDYAYLAMAKAYLGRAVDAQAAAANVVKLDPAWNAERYLGVRGGYPEKQAGVFVEGARKAGLPACIAAAALMAMPDMIRAKSCDA